MLEGIYRVYRCHKKWGIDKIFAEELYKCSSRLGCALQAAEIINKQAINQQTGESPFWIDFVSILDVLKALILENSDYLKTIKRYRGFNNPEGEWGAFKEINKSLKKNLNYDLFDDLDVTQNNK